MNQSSDARSLTSATIKLMDDHCPWPTEPTVEDEKLGTFDAETGLLSFVSVGNSDYRLEKEFDSKALENITVKHLHVHNGDVWNSAESNLATIVARNSESLESIYYCPNDTKGGVMIRPWYHKSLRDKAMTFPKLTKATINSHGLSTFIRCWIAPELRHLEIAFQKNVEVDIKAIFDEVKGFYPKLQRLRIFVKQTGETIQEISMI